MRLFAFLLHMFAFSSTFAYARINRKNAYSRSPTHILRPADVGSDLIATRQHHEPRALLDVCAYLDADAILKSGLLGLPLGLIGNINICLCLSALPLALEANVQIKALVNLLGKNAVAAALTALINNAPGSAHCTYPQHCKPACTPAKPCDFSCDPPYVKQGNQCVCQAPYVSCNGQCTLQGCGSSVPRSLNVRSYDDRFGTVATDSEAQAACKPDETVCGVYGNSPGAFECVDTRYDLESCGGCVVANPFLSYDASTPVGRDCTSIEGADRVSCVSGKCAVRSCISGWKVNPSGELCEPSNLNDGHNAQPQGSVTSKSVYYKGGW